MGPRLFRSVFVKVMFCDVVMCLLNLIRCLGRTVFYGCGLSLVSEVICVYVYCSEPLYMLQKQPLQWVLVTVVHAKPDYFRSGVGAGLAAMTTIIVALQLFGLVFGTIGSDTVTKPTQRSCIADSGGNMLIAYVLSILQRLFYWNIVFNLTLSSLHTNKDTLASSVNPTKTGHLDLHCLPCFS